MNATHTPGHTDIVFDGSPDHKAPVFVEVEDEQGRSIRFGEWLQRPDGYWVLRISASARLIAAAPEMRELIAEQARVSCECDDIPGACNPCRSRALLARIDGGA